MVRNPFQLSLYEALLLLGTLFAGFHVMYLSMWETYPLIPASITLITASVSGMEWQWRRNRNGFTGAIIGGILGANLAVAIHFVCGYTMLEAFEDEGLGLVRGVLAFAPYATVFGITCGGFVWLIACAITRGGRSDKNACTKLCTDQRHEDGQASD